MSTKANITIDQGSDFSTNIVLVDSNGIGLDLTGYTGASEMKKWYTSANGVNFGVAVANGIVTLSMNSATTTTLDPGRYVYDVILTNPTTMLTTRVVEGLVSVTAGVTRNV